MRARIGVSLIISAVLLVGWGGALVPPRGPVQFEITNLKQDTEAQTFGTILRIRGVLRVRETASSGTFGLLLMESRASFETSGITKENSQDAVLVKDGSGLIETSFSSGQTK